MKTRAETGRKGVGRKRNAKNLKRAEIPSKINGLRSEPRGKFIFMTGFSMKEYSG